jgi:hypothetical protein
VHSELFVRRAIRRAKQVRYRHQRVPLDVPTEDSQSEELSEQSDDAEKIAVHVHLHRGEEPKSSRAKHRPRSVLTGQLFDWQWYRDRLTGRPPPAAAKRWGLARNCQSCNASVPSIAGRCPRCAAPQPRRFLAIGGALVGLGVVAAAFILCAHLLGSSVPEGQAPKPLNQWSDDDFMIVEVPATPSPFSYTPQAGTGSGSSPSGAGHH